MKELLQKSLLFKQFSQAEADALLPFTKKKSYYAGNIMFEPGEVIENIYIVNYGSVAINVLKSDDENEYISMISSGQTFGALQLNSEGPSLIGARAIEHVEVLEVNIKDLKGFLDSHPQAALKFYHALVPHLEKVNYMLFNEAIKYRSANLKHHSHAYL